MEDNVLIDPAIRGKMMRTMPDVDLSVIYYSLSGV
jgi:hypothetical protein